MIAARLAAQDKAARRRGQASHDVFVLEDPVCIWDPRGKNWAQKGMISKSHASDDGIALSFAVPLSDGREVRRNLTFLHHRSMPSEGAKEAAQSALLTKQALQRICRFHKHMSVHK